MTVGAFLLRYLLWASICKGIPIEVFERGDMAKDIGFDHLPVKVVRESRVSLPSQIVEQVRSLIVAGYLVAGDPLPSSRTLAELLNVSRGTVVFAYEQLTGEGYLVSSRGGTRVADDLPQVSLKPGSAPRALNSGQLPQFSYHGKKQGLEAGSHGGAATGGGATVGGGATAGGDTFDVRPGQPDVSLLASSTWRASWRAAAASPGATYPPAGSPALRAELAEHLRLMRSTLREPDDILVTAGAREGFRLLLTALHSRVAHRPLRIAVENPGFPSLRRIPQALGHQILPIKVDSCGLSPAYLPTGDHRPDLVLLAPSHQYPLGASMPVSRRLELLAWATEHNVLLVEDDYDSELRYRGDPLPALAALDRSPLLRTQLPAGSRNADGRVVTLGSFSKLLAPGLNLGYMVFPPQLCNELLALRADLGNPVPSIVQDAMTDFLAAGGVRRHTARMRRVYRRRRELVVEHLNGLPGTSLMLMDGGLHAVLTLSADQELDETTALLGARAAGVLVAPLSGYWSQEAGTYQRNQKPENSPRSEGLVLGFGGLSDQQLIRALKRLSLALRELLSAEKNT